MISKNKIKLIKSLELKKYRNELQLFVAEGNKLVGDMLPYFDCELLVAKSAWLKAQGNIEAKEVIIAEEEDLHKASLLKTPQEVLALFRKPHYDLNEVCPEKDLVLASDGIQDPGNLGTIIRLADWFGIRHIVCSLDTVDDGSVGSGKGALYGSGAFSYRSPESGFPFIWNFFGR